MNELDHGGTVHDPSFAGKKRKEIENYYNGLKYDYDVLSMYIEEGLREMERLKKIGF